MNKDLLNHLSADEQPLASRLDSVAEDMKLSPSFQWELENRLIDSHKTKSRRSQGWPRRVIPALGWLLAATGAVILINWAIRSQAPDLPPAAAETSVPEMSFETNIRQGNICTGPLAAVHGFGMFITNEDKTRFIELDPEKAIGEVRSFAWSGDGKHLAIIGNTTGSGTIHVVEPIAGQIEYVLSGLETGYLRDAAWSRDGRQFAIWSSQNIDTLYVLNADGTGLVERQLDVKILGRPQFAPDGKSVLFYGADSTSGGLFAASLDGAQIRNMNPFIEDESGFAFSRDGAQLAYVSMDRASGKAVVMTVDTTTGAIINVLGSLPIPKGSGSAIPDAAHLSWSPDGKFVVFEFGRYETDRAIYLAATDGTGLVKIADSAHTPAISADGRCLAYVSNKQVFLLDLHDVFTAPVLVADLPAGRSIADFKLDKLQWRP